MGLSASQRTALAAQGLTIVDDFADFGKDELTEALKNMRTSIPGVPGTPAVVVAGVETVAAVPPIAPILPVVLPARCTHRLLVAAVAWHYYTDTGREILAANMHYNNVLKDFHLEWKAITAMAETSASDVPRITKNNPPLQWTDTFKDYCLNTFGVRKAPLAYVIRDTADVLPEALAPGVTVGESDPLVAGKAYGNGGSVFYDLVSRLSHTHPLFSTDNAKVYSALEEATRGTAYGSTVKAFSRRRDGRAAWLALVSSHAGSDKWESLQKENTRWLMNTKWTGQNYSLEKFCNHHRSKFVNLEEAKNHVDFQLPTAHTRVGYLLDNITNSDADLRAAIANIRQNVHDTRSDFEKAVSVLLPVDPFIKKKQNNNNANASNADANVASGTTSTTTDSTKKHGSSGVRLGFHNHSQYQALSAAQKNELSRWRSTPEGKRITESERKKRKNNYDSRHSNKQLETAIRSALAQERKKQKETEDVDAMAQMIATAAASSPSASATSSTTEPVPVNGAHRAAAAKLLRIKARKSKESEDKQN